MAGNKRIKCLAELSSLPGEQGVGKSESPMPKKSYAPIRHNPNFYQFHLCVDYVAN